MRKLLIGTLMVCFALIGCSDGGGGGGNKDNSCDGPVPCLTQNWGNQYVLFYDGDIPVVLVSDGEAMGVAGTYEVEGEMAIVALAGPVLNCYDASINSGGVDFDFDGTSDYSFTSASGHLRVCDETLRIYNIVIEGEAEDDIYATFDSIALLSASNHLSTDAPISVENVEKVKIRIKLLEQLMEE